MAQVSQPTQFINYISQFKKCFVTRNNGVLTQKFKLDTSISDIYYFQFVNNINQIVSLSGRTFNIFGSWTDAKSVTHLLFETDNGTVDAENNILSFRINTYTNEYLNVIKTTKECNITIVETTGGNTQVVLRDVCLCYKRPIEEDITPTPVVAGAGLQLNGYVMSLQNPVSGSFGAGYNVNLGIDSPTFAFGENLITEGNQLVIGRYNESNSNAAFIIGNGTNQERANVFTVNYYNGNTSGGIFYSNGIQVATLNDISGSTSYTAGEGIGISDQNVISLTATIPTSASQLTNDKNYISGITITIEDSTGIDISYNTTQLQFSTAFEKSVDDIIRLDYSNVSGNLVNNGFALTSQIPTNVSQLTNDIGYLSSIVINIDGTDETQMTSLCLDNSFYVYQNMVGVNASNVYQSMQDSGLFVDFALTSAIPTSASQLTNDTGNKLRFNSDPVQHIGTWALSYNPEVDIYYTEISSNSSGAVRIQPIASASYDNIIDNGQGFVIEQWIKPLDDIDTTEYPDATLHFEIKGDVNLLGDLPSSVNTTKYYSFVRRVVKNNDSVIEQISFTAEFD